jgi:hypothetical protein
MFWRKKREGVIVKGMRGRPRRSDRPILSRMPQI